MRWISSVSSPLFNLFKDTSPSETRERFLPLLQHGHVRIERIVSGSNVEPIRQVQEQDEWIAVLQGSASIDRDGEQVGLTRGEPLFLSARVPHTVLSVAEGTVWLAGHRGQELPG